MAILRYESDEVASNFRGACPLCNSRTDFTVEKKGRFGEPTFSCPSCGVVWEYWVDWENPPKMKGARLVKVDKDGKGAKLLDTYLGTALWQSVIDDKTIIADFEPKAQKQPRWKLGSLHFKRMEPSERAPSETLVPTTEILHETPAATPTETPSGAPTVETFSIYGFKVGYPVGWQVIRNRKNSNSKGSLILENPSRFEINIVWGTLAEAKEKYPTPAQFADAALKGIRERREVTTLDEKDRRIVELCGHEAVFSYFAVDFVQRGYLFKKTNQKLDSRSLLVYCEESQRYFVISTQTPSETAQDQSEVFENTVRSFNCHPTP